MIDAANMTHAEYFRMYGSLSERRCLELIALSEDAPDLSGIAIKIKEAKGQFPAEDFLASVQKQLNELRRNLRSGDNKDTLGGIIEALEEIAQSTLHASEYGCSELNAALKTVREKA